MELMVLQAGLRWVFAGFPPPSPAARETTKHFCSRLFSVTAHWGTINSKIPLSAIVIFSIAAIAALTVVIVNVVRRISRNRYSVSPVAFEWQSIIDSKTLLHQRV